MVMHLILLVTALVYASSYPTGAPVAVCESMKPGHLFGAQTEPCPFLTTPGKTLLHAGDTVELTLNSTNPNELFKGFLVIAFDDAMKKPLGSFSFSKRSSHGKTKSCDGHVQDMATQMDNSPKSSVKVVWTPPESYEGTVIFMTTFVKNFSKYWVKEQSAPVRVSHHAAVDDNRALSEEATESEHPMAKLNRNNDSSEDANEASHEKPRPAFPVSLKLFHDFNNATITHSHKDEKRLLEADKPMTTTENPRLGFVPNLKRIVHWIFH